MNTKTQELAARVRELRELSNISIADMAEKLEIDVAIYQGYETCKTDIPASIIIELADILGVDSAVLLTGQEARLRVFSVTREGKGVCVERRRQYNYEALATSFIGKKAEPFIVTVEPKPENETLKTASHIGQEFNYILEGRLKIIIHSNEIILEKGDSIYFDSSYEHAMQALDGSKAVFLAILV